MDNDGKKLLKDFENEGKKDAAQKIIRIIEEDYNISYALNDIKLSNYQQHLITMIKKIYALD